jgi:hypothetical protein
MVDVSCASLILHCLTQPLPIARSLFGPWPNSSLDGRIPHQAKPRKNCSDQPPSGAIQ